jgi:hypothetical protein
MDTSFKYIIGVGGIENDKDYPYTGVEANCEAKSSEFITKISGFQDITSESEYDLQVAVANMGPIAAAMDASQQSFKFYKSGVYYSSECSSVSLDFAVVVIGYGVYNGQDYWLCKNDWGTEWGMVKIK